MSMVLAAFVAALFVLSASPTRATNDDSDERRARIACMGGTAGLVLRADDENDDDEDDDDEPGISIRVQVDVPRPVWVWRIVLVHERRIVFQGTRRPSRPSFSLRLVRWVPDWRGRQTVAARIANGSGRTCRLQVTI